MTSRKIKITITYTSYCVLIDLIGRYIKQFQNLEVLILQHLKPKLWAKAIEEKDIKINLELFQAAAIKEVLSFVPGELPIAEKNELRKLLFFIDEKLISGL